jgi:hypothetical protein
MNITCLGLEHQLALATLQDIKDMMPRIKAALSKLK